MRFFYFFLHMSKFFRTFAAEKLTHHTTMKRLAQLTLFFITLVALVSCGKQNQPVSDPRDAFIGEYDFQATGNLDLHIGSAVAYSIPLNENGSFTIAPAEEPGEVLIIGYNDTIHATVANQYLLFESTTTNMEYSGVSLQLTFIYGKAKLENNTLTWHTDVLGTASYNAIALTGTGQIDVIATR